MSSAADASRQETHAGADEVVATYQAAAPPGQAWGSESLLSVHMGPYQAPSDAGSGEQALFSRRIDEAGVGYKLVVRNLQQTQDELRAKNIQLVEAANENAENLALRVKAEEAAAKAEAINAKQQELAAAQRDEIAHLKAMLEQQNVKRAELEGQVVLWKRRAKRVEAARLKLTEQVAAATQQAAEAHVSSDTVRKLEAAMKRLQSQLKDSLARVQRRDDRLAKAEARVGALKEQRDDYRQQVTAKVEELTHLQNEYKTLAITNAKEREKLLEAQEVARQSRQADLDRDRERKRQRQQEQLEARLWQQKQLEATTVALRQEQAAEEERLKSDLVVLRQERDGLRRRVETLEVALAKAEVKQQQQEDDLAATHRILRGKEAENNYILSKLRDKYDREAGLRRL